MLPMIATFLKITSLSQAWALGLSSSDVVGILLRADSVQRIAQRKMKIAPPVHARWEAVRGDATALWAVAGRLTPFSDLAEDSTWFT